MGSTLEDSLGGGGHGVNFQILSIIVRGGEAILRFVYKGGKCSGALSKTHFFGGWGGNGVNFQICA